MVDSTTVTIDRETLKALAVDTRMDILQLLAVRPHTLSELAEALQFSHSTVKEHVDKLCASSLIVKEDNKRKWKYYSLTSKGKSIVIPEQRKVLITFAFSLFAIFVSGAAWLTQSFYLHASDFTLKTASSRLAPTADVVYAPVAESFAATAVSDSSTALISVSHSPLVLATFFLLGAGLLVALFCLGYLYRKPSKIILRESKNKKTH